jgi:hypothetical protein
MLAAVGVVDDQIFRMFIVELIAFEPSVMRNLPLQEIDEDRLPVLEHLIDDGPVEVPVLGRDKLNHGAAPFEGADCDDGPSELPP